MKTFFFNLYRFFLPLFIVLFIISRLSYLNLPFYWDEAWSYATAVFDMHEHGLAILPGTTNPELTRGHPLLFYFLSSLWMKLSGTGLIMVHLFPLIVSCMLLIAVFKGAEKLFDRHTAIAATILFALQSWFMAQSTLLLPEVMLALWTVLTVYAYFNKKWALFVVFSVFLVMTKETGMVLIGTLFLDKIMLENFFNNGQKRSVRFVFKELAILSIPVITFTAFMILQKIRVGWLFYPEHINLAILNPYEIINRIRLFSSKLLFQHGRSILFILSIGALIYLIIKKSINKHAAHQLLFSVVFIVFYIIFSAVNFFTVRYLLSVLPFFIITGTWLILQSLQKVYYLKIVTVIILALQFFYYTFIGNQNESDVSLGYKNTVLLQKQAVNYAEEMQWHEKTIYAAFLMQYYMAVPKLGYLNDQTHPFISISNKPEKEFDIYIFCSNENDIKRSVIKNNVNYAMEMKFENKGAWVEYYMKKVLQSDPN